MSNESQVGPDASYAANAAIDNRSVYRDWAASYDEVFAGKTDINLVN
ncbi:MAG: hypothetical protein AAGD96_15310 [Chloroflexota bacterium]